VVDTSTERENKTLGIWRNKANALLRAFHRHMITKATFQARLGIRWSEVGLVQGIYGIILYDKAQQ